MPGRTPLWLYRFADRLIEKAVGRTVLSGPFSGMTYLADVQWGPLAPKVLGTYEKELHPAISDIVRRAPDLIVDVGAAEGYYVAGLARLVSQARVVAFEADETSRTQLSRLCVLNSVETRCQLLGRCDEPALEKALQSGRDRSVVIMDVEGMERELLDPAQVPSLLKAIILVEVHDSFDSGIDALLKNRFGESHRVREYNPCARTRDDFPKGKVRWSALCPEKLLLKAMHERRGETTHWLFMEPLKA